MSGACVYIYITCMCVHTGGWESERGEEVIKANLFSFQFFQRVETFKRPHLLRAGVIYPPKQKTDTALG